MERPPSERRAGRDGKAKRPPPGSAPGGRSGIIEPLTALSLYFHAIERLAGEPTIDREKLAAAMVLVREQLARAVRLAEDVPEGPEAHRPDGR